MANEIGLVTEYKAKKCVDKPYRKKQLTSKGKYRKKRTIL